MNSELEEKQKYLKTTITEADHSLQSFIDFLRSVKENGSNIENWTLDELKQQVENYKQARYNPKEEIKEVIF